MSYQTKKELRRQLMIAENRAAYWEHAVSHWNSVALNRGQQLKELRENRRYLMRLSDALHTALVAAVGEQEARRAYTAFWINEGVLTPEGGFPTAEGVLMPDGELR